MSKVISFINQKGGVGKSVLADELCFEFDRQSLDYNIYDIDNQGGLIHKSTDNDNADYVVVDTPGRLDDNVLQIIEKSNIIVVPTRASLKDIPPLQETLNQVKKHKKKKAVVIIVLNCWNGFTTCTQFEEWLRSEYPEFDKMVTLPQAEALSQAELLQRSVIEYKKTQNISIQLNKLWTIVKCELGMKL